MILVDTLFVRCGHRRTIGYLENPGLAPDPDGFYKTEELILKCPDCADQENNDYNEYLFI